MSSPAVSNASPARPNLYFSLVVVVLAILSASSFLRNASSNVVAACYFTWVSLWLARLVSGDKTAIFDGLVLLVGLLPSSYPLIRRLLELASRYSLPALPIISLALLIVTFLISVLFFKSRGNKDDIWTNNQNPEKHCRPFLFPCRTTHARMFPRKHSFAYSYLLVGVPVGPKDDSCLSTPMLTVDPCSSPRVSKRKGWFHIQGSDYLERGHNMDLKGKLTQYLRSQNVSDDEWHHAYLVTAAKFLGYSFNPVSFWYIYSASHQLVMVILEVNNTFGERRMYLLKGSGPDYDGTSNQNDATDHARQITKFTDAWAKDFHVSPFNSRKGSYSLSAVDPFKTSQESIAHIDNNIVLRSSEEHAKLVARVFSVGAPQDPNTLSTWQALCFIGNWWWVGFVTFPRILKEAYRLYFWRSLEVFFRPEVAPTSIGRDPTTIEKHLEDFFCRYLQYLVSHTDQPVRVSYTPAPGLGETREYLSPSGEKGGPTSSLAINVTSPAFYSRFVHYNHTSEALDREALFTNEKNRTAWISNPQKLKLLPLNHPRYTEPLQPKLGRLGDAIGWQLLRKWRCAPTAPSYPDFPQGPDPAFIREDIRPKGFAACDEYVMRNCRDAWLYKRCLLKLFLAQRLGLGYTEIIDLLDLIVRVCLVVGVLLVIPSDLRTLLERGAEDVGSAGPKVLGFNAVHAWSLIKGAI